MNFKTNTSLSLKNEKSTHNRQKEFPTEPKPVPTRNNNYIKEIIISAADESTTHGIDHFFKREHPFIRIVWAVCFFASAAVCFYMITISIMNYLDYETVTKAEQVKEQTVDFPTVSICNLNPYLTNKSWEYVQSILVQNGLMNSSGPNEEFMSYLYTDIQFFRFLVGVNAIGSNLTHDYLKSFGYSIHDTILSCEYNVNYCSFEDDFIWYYDFMYGNCFRFNSGI
jgi:phage shock protein PspC (stress-responsive transcriptional regulator)